MTQNKAQKTAARRRMSETGEPYSVARRAVEREHVPDVAADPPAADQAARPRGESWYASRAEEAGISVAEFKAQEEAANLQYLADKAQERADGAQERADGAQERADEAEEAATMAQEAADMALEAADMTQEWADEHEQERARRRADQAQEAADQAQAAADRAQRQADEVQDAADQAEEAAGDAQALAEEFAEGAADQAWTQPGRGWGQDDFQARVERVLQRFGRVWERADLLIGRAERMMKSSEDEPGGTGSA